MLFMIIAVSKAKNGDPWGWYAAGVIGGLISMLIAVGKGGYPGWVWALWILEVGIWTLIIKVRVNSGYNARIDQDKYNTPSYLSSGGSSYSTNGSSYSSAGNMNAYRNSTNYSGVKKAGWICCGCGKENSAHVFLCSCGMKKSENDAKKEQLEKAKDQEKNLEKNQGLNLEKNQGLNLEKNQGLNLEKNREVTPVRAEVSQSAPADDFVRVYGYMYTMEGRYQFDFYKQERFCSVVYQTSPEKVVTVYGSKGCWNVNKGSGTSSEITVSESNTGYTVCRIQKESDSVFLIDQFFTATIKGNTVSFGCNGREIAKTTFVNSEADQNGAKFCYDMQVKKDVDESYVVMIAAFPLMIS